MSSFGKFCSGILLGGVLGAVIGLLLAPRKGVETRDILKEEFEKRCMDPVKDKYSSGVHTVQESVSSFKDKYNESVGVLKEKAKEKADDLKGKALHLTEQLEEKGRQILKRPSDAVDVPSETVEPA
jgi:gas vesicle protein